MRSILVLGVLLCAACASKSEPSPAAPAEPHLTSELTLDKFTASYGAFSDGLKLDVFVVVIGDKLGFMRLADGDTITVDVDGTSAPTTERIENGKPTYVASVSSPPSSPIITVTFARGAEKSVAKVQLGPSFALKTTPSAVKVGDVVSVDLDPPPDLAKWQTIIGTKLRHVVMVDGDCIEGGTQSFTLCAKDSPQGTCNVSYPLSWDTSTMKLVAGSNGCKVDVSMRLETGNSTTWEGPFKGGMECVQHRNYSADLTK